MGTTDMHNNFDYTMDRKSRAYAHMEFPAVFLRIVIVLSLFGNILVVISVFFLRLRSLTSIFILNLALSDLLFTVGLMLKIYQYVWGWTPEGSQTICTMAQNIFPTAYYSSIIFLVLMCAECYLSLVHPHLRWKKGPCFTLVINCVWLMSILAALAIPAVPSLRFCRFGSLSEEVAVISVHCTVSVCTFLVVAFFHIRIWQNMQKSPRNQTLKTVRLAYTLVATFFICWAPDNIINFLFILHFRHINFYPSDINDTYSIYHLLAYARCCLSPMIYGLFGLYFRKTVREMLQKEATANSAQMELGEHSRGEVNVNNESTVFGHRA